jgi:hypothetical protein
MRTNKADNFNRNITMFLRFAICIIYIEMKNQLPGGCHTSDDEAKRQESISLPKHNRASEKNFADMKQMRHFKPNASIEHIEATLMWINNKTRHLYHLH